MQKPRPTSKPKPEQKDYSSTDGEIPVVRWSNRRRMAWWAMYILCGYTMFYWTILPLWFNWWNLNVVWLTTIGDSYSWFASTMAATIVAYLGFTNGLSNPLKRAKNMFSGRSEEQSDEEDSGEDEYYEVKTDGKSE